MPEGGSAAAICGGGVAVAVVGVGTWMLRTERGPSVGVSAGWPERRRGAIQIQWWVWIDGCQWCRQWPRTRCRRGRLRFGAAPAGSVRSAGYGA